MECKTRAKVEHGQKYGRLRCKKIHIFSEKEKSIRECMKFVIRSINRYNTVSRPGDQYQASTTLGQVSSCSLRTEKLHYL